MNFNVKSSKSVNRGAMAAALMLVLVAGGAQASDGTVNFNGNVIASTCKIDVTPGSGAVGAVTLADISVSALAKAGDFGMRTPFKFALSACSTAAGAPTKVSAYFEPTSDVNLATGNLLNKAITAPASGVEIALLSGSATTLNGVKAFDAIVIGAVKTDGTIIANSPQVAIAGGVAELNYYAQYQATAAATAGAVQASVTYTMAYN